jgi:hypothetical protein
MSYEAHVTMVIQCLTISAYTYAVLMLADDILFMVIAAAKYIPPTDFYSFLFNIYFGFVALGMAITAMNLLRKLFFLEAFKEKMAQPIYDATAITKDGVAMKFTNNSEETPDAIVGLFLDLCLGNNSAPGSYLKSQESTKQSGPADATEAQPECPATPDSAHSNADTVPYDKPPMHELKISKGSGGESGIKKDAH